MQWETVDGEWHSVHEGNCGYYYRVFEKPTGEIGVSAVVDGGEIPQAHDATTLEQAIRFVELREESLRVPVGHDLTADQVRRISEILGYEPGWRVA